jgi:hypothetical protein
VPQQQEGWLPLPQSQSQLQCIQVKSRQQQGSWCTCVASLFCVAPTPVNTMGFRFQKRVKILPGITLNIGKKGVSTTVGVKGAHVTTGHGKTRTTVGIPGTGLSHTSIEKNADTPAASQPQGFRDSAIYKVLKFLCVTALVVMGAIAVFFGSIFLSDSKKKGRKYLD